MHEMHDFFHYDCNDLSKQETLAKWSSTASMKTEPLAIIEYI